MERHDARAQPVQREPVQERCRPVVQHQPHTVADTVAGRRIAVGKHFDGRCRVAVSQRAGRDAVTLCCFLCDMEERPFMPGTNGLPERREDGVGQSGSQWNTSPERSSGM